MTQINMFAYNNLSASASNLSKALGIKKIKHIDSQYTGSDNKLILNWGSSSLPSEVSKSMIINEPSAVSNCTDKIKFFKAMESCEGVNTPKFTESPSEAYSWLLNNKDVVLRSKVNGHSGEGINLLTAESVAGGDQDFKNIWAMYGAKFATQYVLKKDEYRVHVINGVAVDVRRKALAEKYSHLKEKLNWKIRTHQNGFIFQKEDFQAPDQVVSSAVKAVDFMGLDFGAVDVVWNNFYEKAYVLEINTAPGLEGSTIDSYKESFEKLFNDIKAAKGSNKLLTKKPTTNPELFSFDKPSDTTSLNEFISSIYADEEPED